MRQNPWKCYLSLLPAIHKISNETIKGLKSMTIISQTPFFHSNKQEENFCTPSPKKQPKKKKTKNIDNPIHKQRQVGLRWNEEVKQWHWAQCFNQYQAFEEGSQTKNLKHEDQNLEVSLISTWSCFYLKPWTLDGANGNVNLNQVLFLIHFMNLR